ADPGLDRRGRPGEAEPDRRGERGVRRDHPRGAPPRADLSLGARARPSDPARAAAPPVGLAQAPAGNRARGLSAPEGRPRTGAAMRRADRLFQIVQLLRSRRIVTAGEIAAELEVSLRTVYRDIADLCACGVPIEGEAGVGYALARGFDLPPLMFDEEE